MNQSAEPFTSSNTRANSKKKPQPKLQQLGTLTFRNLPWAQLIAVINAGLLTEAWTASWRGEGQIHSTGDAILMSF